MNIDSVGEPVAMPRPIAGMAPEPKPTKKAPRPDQKTVFLATAYGINVRDVLRTDIFRVLRDSGHRIVIFSPTAEDPEFIKELSADNVILEKLIKHKPDKYEQWFDSLRLALFSDFSKAVTYRTIPRYKRPAWKKALLKSSVLAARAAGPRKTQNALRWLNLKVFPDPYYKAAFDKYKPDLVVLSRVFNFSHDYHVLKRAILENVPTVLLVSSWDNLTNKGVFPARIDRLVVWNDLQVKDAEQHHFMPSKNVFVGGVPQFDVFADTDKLPTREAFFKGLGADPSRPLITIAMGGQRCPYEYEIVELVWRAAREGRFGKNCQVLARSHPMQKAAIPEHLLNQPDLFFDHPGKRSAYDDTDASLDDLRRLGATMRYSSVVLNHASTTTIDAAIFDTPACLVGFDGFTERPFLDSVRRLYTHTHYVRLLEVTGLPILGNMDELVNSINRYLENPALDREKRQALVKWVAGEVDGRASQRIGQHLVDIVEGRVPADANVGP